jgi:hypothetical protein
MTSVTTRSGNRARAAVSASIPSATASTSYRDSSNRRM